MVLWSAGAPDVQFSNPFFNGVMRYTDYPNAVFPTVYAFTETKPGKEEVDSDCMLSRSKYHIVKQQCDIVEDFKMTFPGFLDGCEYLTDNHNITSEVTVYATDLLKRYQLAVPQSQASSGPDRLHALTPFFDPGSIGYVIMNMFNFYRGGLRYKATIPATTGTTATQPTYPVFQVRLAPYNSTAVQLNYSYGQASLRSVDPATEVDFSVPWYTNVPFARADLPLVSTVSVTNNYQQITDVNLSFYGLAVRDDYILGFLIAPIPATPGG